MSFLKVPQSELDMETVKTILSEYRIHNADITLKYDATTEDLIDVIEGNRWGRNFKLFCKIYTQLIFLHLYF